MGQRCTAHKDGHRREIKTRWRRKVAATETGLKTRHYIRNEERFLSAQADAFARANAEEEVSLLRSK